MGISNPAPLHPLPGDLQARVENALNNVSMQEAELVRLTKLVDNQKSELHAIISESKSLEVKIKSQKVELSDLTSHVNQKTKDLNELQYMIQDANHELEEATRQKTEILNLVASKTKELDERIAAVKLSEKDLEDKHSDLSTRESEHKKKVEKLLEALK